VAPLPGGGVTLMLLSVTFTVEPVCGSYNTGFPGMPRKALLPNAAPVQDGTARAARAGLLLLVVACTPTAPQRARSLPAGARRRPARWQAEAPATAGALWKIVRANAGPWSRHCRIATLKICAAVRKNRGRATATLDISSDSRITPEVLEPPGDPSPVPPPARALPDPYRAGLSGARTVPWQEAFSAGK
jgi:hypothetical protein